MDPRGDRKDLGTLPSYYPLAGPRGVRCACGAVVRVTAPARWPLDLTKCVPGVCTAQGLLAHEGQVGGRAQEGVANAPASDAARLHGAPNAALTPRIAPHET